MRLALVLAVAAVAGFLAAPAGATNECRGLQVCVPVAGPWVVVPPASTVPRTPVRWVLTCPKGYVVGGLDAELTDPAIDVTFDALIGAPVNPGISTSRMAVFVATMTRTPARPASFRPHIGCMPSSGGGGRIPTSARAVVPPGKPTVRHVANVKLVPRHTRRIVQGCARGEHLVDAHTAIAYDPYPPDPLMARSVHVTQQIVAGRVVVSAKADAGAGGALVQVQAVCAGGS